MKENMVLLDSGNSSIKVAKRIDGNLENYVFNSNMLESFIESSQDELFVVSSVKDREKIKGLLDKNGKKSLFINDFKIDQQFLDFEHPYSETIGDDRIIQIYHLAQKRPNERIALIDAGSFITVDYINKGEYLGGDIFPGVNTFLSSYKNGSDLPGLNKNTLKDYLFTPKDTFPKDTNTAILHGCYIYLSNLLKNAGRKTDNFFVTGGDSDVILNTVQFESIDINIETNSNHLFDSLEYFSNKFNDQGYLQ